MTAIEDPEVHGRVLRAGPSEVLAKGISFEEVLGRGEAPRRGGDEG